MAAAQQSIPTLSGQWRVIHHVEASNRPRYVGLVIEFLFTLTDLGNAVVGSGRKIGVNGRAAADAEASLLEISGTAGADEVKLSLLEWREESSGPSIIGEIVWQAVDENQFAGSFRVDVGDTRGRSEATREQPRD